MVIFNIIAKRGSAFLVIYIPDDPFVTEYFAEDPAFGNIIRVDDSSAAKLDSLAGVVYPEEIKVEGGLNDSENDRDGFGISSVW
jgi:hypothetical protein